MTTEKIAITVPMTAEQAEDMQSMACMIWLGLSIDTDPLTHAELESGWRTRPHGDHEHRYAVGWRREKQREENEAARQKEMAACPYRACTCGWHDD